MEIPLLTIDVNEFPIFDPAIRAIPVYRKIIERDKGSKGDFDGRKKKQAIKELAFIHLYTHFYKNPYWKYPTEPVDTRLQKLTEHFEFADDWKIDEDLNLALTHYRENIVKSLAIEMLDGAEHAARETVTYFKNVNYNLRDSRGNMLYSPEKVMKAIKEVGSTLDELKGIRERVEKEMSANSGKVYGGGKVGNRELPRDRRGGNSA